MNYLKALILTVLGLSLMQCKVMEDTDFLTIADEQTGEEEQFYTGDVNEILYFKGGGMPIPNTPNYEIDFAMVVNGKNQIDATLDTPECKTNGSVSVEAYSHLIKLIEEVKVDVDAGPMPLDAPSHYVSLDRGKKLNDTYYFNLGAPLLSPADALEIQKRIEEIVADLKKENPCGQSVGEVTALKYSEYPVTHNNSITQPYFPPPGVMRTFKIVQVDGAYRVSGYESIVDENKSCKRKLDNQLLNIDLNTEMEQITVQKTDSRCEIMGIPVGQLSLEIMRDQNVIQGTAGCWNTHQLHNHRAFVDKFTNWLKRQEQKCNYIDHTM